MSKVSGFFKHVGQSMDSMSKGKELYYAVWVIVLVGLTIYFEVTDNTVFAWICVVAFFFSNELLIRALKQKPGQYVYHYNITVHGVDRLGEVTDSLARNIPPSGR